MLLGCGLDLVDVARVRRELALDAELFKDSLFTAREIADCDRRPEAERHYAARFAAKEAFLKALGTGAPDAGAWREVEIAGDDGERPRILLHGAVARAARERGVRAIALAYSHRRTCAVAAVTVET